MRITRDITYKHNDTMFMSAIGRNKVFNVELVGLSICDPAYYVQRSKCKMYVFEYIYHGRGEVHVNGSICHPQAGDVYILPEGSDHKYHTDKTDKWRKIWFTASGLLIEQLLRAYAMTNVYWVRQAAVKHLFVDMFVAVKNGVPDQHGVTALLLHKLIMECANHLNPAAGHASPDAVAIRKFLDANLTRPVTLDTIACHVHKSPSQVIRTFKKEYAATPIEYIMRERINHAKMLLANHSMLSVKEVAFMLNFSDEHYFSNVFKQKVGVPPSMYRQMSQLDIH